MTDLDAILSRDPRSHTREDRDTLIRMYRERRHQYNLAPAKAAKPPKPDATLSLHQALKGTLDL